MNQEPSPQKIPLCFRKSGGTSTSFRPFQPAQPYLLPPEPQDWLTEDHLAYYVFDTVDALDLTAFFASYEADARAGSRDHRWSNAPVAGRCRLSPLP